MLIEDKEPLVSVIMPCYNVADFIEKAIESIFNQTYKNIELVCVDDGSIDNTAEIIKEKAIIHNIVFIQQPNKGVVEARRCAIIHAKGDYIALVDADDYIDENALGKSIEKIKNKNVDAVLWEFYSSDGMQEESPLLTYNCEETLSGIDALQQTIGGWGITGIGLFKKEIYLNAYDLYDKKKLKSYNADEYITRLVFSISKLVFKAKIKYFYVMNPKSATRKFKLDWITSFDTDNAIKELCIEKGIYDEKRVALLNQFCFNLIKIKNDYKKNKSDLSSDDRKLIVNKCKVEIRKNSISDYLLILFKSKRTIKNKINFFITILYFIGY